MRDPVILSPSLGAPETWKLPDSSEQPGLVAKSGSQIEDLPGALFTYGLIAAPRFNSKLEPCNPLNCGQLWSQET